MILNVDFASLLADYAGVKTPNESQGHSFRDNLKGNTPKDWRKEMYYRYWTQHSNRPAHMGIRNERYKLMFFYGDRLNMTGSEIRPRHQHGSFTTFNPILVRITTLITIPNTPRSSGK